MENKEEKVKTQPQIILSNPWKIFALEVFLFCLTLALGIAAAVKFNSFVKAQEISLPPISFWQFIFYFLLATFFILFLVFVKKFKREKGIIYKTFFVLAVGFGGLLLLDLWLPSIFSLILIAILIFYWLKKPSVLIHDLAIILGIAGVGSALGLRLNPLLVIALLIIFSIYDFIAVYKTKHMVKMAKEMIEHKAILALIIPSKISDFKESLKKVEPGGKFLILGGGDIVFPLILAASLVPSGIFNSLIVALFALIGLFVGFWFFVSQKIRQPIPALPPIAIFSIVGFLLTLIIR